MTSGPAPSAQHTALVGALASLRDVVRAVALPFDSPGAVEARVQARRIADQLDDYVLPRLQRLDAPLLVVVGGSTGAGKSTLVNSLVGAEVSQAGVLRPTTRGPVLVHHPDDAGWFDDQRLLPTLPRVTGAPGGTDTLFLVPSRALLPGIALLDAPDIDSVVTANRDLAQQLLGAADLWLFLTTAARYADAVPWTLLRDAGERGAAVAIVLDRVPPEAVEEIRAHLAQMLRDEGLGRAPLFVVAETRLEGGRLPEDAVVPLRSWLRQLAADAEGRAALARSTLAGVLDSYSRRIPALVRPLQAQEQSVATLRAGAVTSYDDASEAIDAAMRDGTLLRGEVLARWQDVVGGGDLFRGLQSGVGRLRDRLTASLRGRPQPTDELAGALESGVVALVHAEADRAAEAAVSRWRQAPEGRALLGDATPLQRSAPDLTERAQRAVRDWQGAVLDLVRAEGLGRRRTAQVLSYGVNGVGLVVMVAVFASTGGLTGGEVVVAGGASALSQKVLEALLGDQAVRSLSARARTDLRRRVEELLQQECQRFLDALADVPLPVTADALESAYGAIRTAMGPLS